MTVPASDRAARLSAGLLSALTLLALGPPLATAAGEFGGWLGGAWSLLRYFTITTNLAIGVGFALIAWRGRQALTPRLQGGLMLAIVLVGVVFNLLLGSDPHASRLDALCDHIHHIAMPLLVPVWWLAFAPHGALDRRDPWRWALYPLAYAAYIFLRVGLETPGPGIAYPYFFMDAGVLGYPLALANMGAIALGFVGAGMAVVWLDRRLGRVSG